MRACGPSSDLDRVLRFGSGEEIYALACALEDDARAGDREAAAALARLLAESGLVLLGR